MMNKERNCAMKNFVIIIELLGSALLIFGTFVWAKILNNKAIQSLAGVANFLYLIPFLMIMGVMACGNDNPAVGVQDLAVEGFGADSIGGEGGEEIWVTNLNDSGPGSFREAVMQKNPRIVRFKVGGVIKLSTPVVVENGRLTIDGTSAADMGGITLCENGLIFSGLYCRDVFVQHIRVRRARREGDCIGIYNGAHRVVIDHCSISWADDENIGINKGHYVTVQWCIISEGIIEGEHSKGAHSMGMLVAHGADHVSLHHNFWTGNVNRNALLFGPGDGYGEEVAIYMPTTVFDFRNNLVYNFVGGTQIKYAAHINVVNNYYRYGPSSKGGPEVHIFSPKDLSYSPYYPGCDYPKLYCKGNIGPHRPEDNGDDWAVVNVDSTYSSDPLYRSEKPFLVPPVTTQPAGKIVELILSEAGAHPHDDVDLRLIEEFRTGKGRAGYGYVEWKNLVGVDKMP